ncbi:hypothetical protein Tco_0594748 [Tanacetum coccineum]
MSLFKEAESSVVYDVLKAHTFQQACQESSANDPRDLHAKIWASAYNYNEYVRFKRTTKSTFLNLDQFRKNILQICPKFVKEVEEPPLEEENSCFSSQSCGKTSYDSLRFFSSSNLWNVNNKQEDPLIPRRNKVNWHYARDDLMFTTINAISRNEDTQLYETILPADLTNMTLRNSESYKEYYAIASGKIPPKTKASKKKADSNATTKQKPPTVPKEKKGKKTGKGKQKAKELETIFEAILTEAEQLKIITKRSLRRLTLSSQRMIKMKKKMKMMRTFPDDDEDAKSGEITQKFKMNKMMMNEAQTVSKMMVHTPSHVSSSDDEDSDNEVEGVDVEGDKSDEDATYVEDQGNEADRDTNANLEGRDDVMADVKYPVHSITEPSFFAPTNHPPTLNPLFTQLQQPPILTPATTPSSSLLNLPNFGSLFGFDNRLKALEDNFSEFKQINQYAEALSSIPSIVDQYLANKMKEAVDVAVQLKSDRI